ncbi:hypothetical protein GCM10023203_41870 [Actinomycetospora straminea]|uniref:Uncharacterized protein n=1 Tax=Actinomycetospora straminea TaxID=663607 RepID=A0ABP9ETW6_9PSEU
MVLVAWLVLLIGVLLGALAGATVCFKVLRDEMLGRVRPQMDVMELKVDNLRTEVGFLADNQDALRREIGPGGAGLNAG